MKPEEQSVALAIYEIVGNDLQANAPTAEIEALLPAAHRPAMQRHLDALVQSQYIGQGATNYNVLKEMLPAVQGFHRGATNAQPPGLHKRWGAVLIAVDELSNSNTQAVSAATVSERLGMSAAELTEVLLGLNAHGLVVCQNPPLAQVTARGHDAANVLRQRAKVVVR
jgi:hypothetical protein